MIWARLFEHSLTMLYIEQKQPVLYHYYGLLVLTHPFSLSCYSEFMSGGSVYDYLHKHKGTFKLPSLLKVAIDVSKGMNYLHQNNILHRDLKAANLLMDENEVFNSGFFYDIDSDNTGDEISICAL